MNISTVNNQQLSYSFKGLWGDSHSKNSGFHNGQCFIKTFEYHPFVNESTESIQNAVDSKTKYTWQDLYEKIALYKSIVIVRDKLPFTKEEYDLYKGLKSEVKTKTRFRVEKGLADAKLYQYLNSRTKYFCCKYFHPAKKIISKFLNLKK